MLRRLDTLAAAWLRWRRRRAVNIDPALMQFAINRIAMDEHEIILTATAPCLVPFAEECAALLDKYDATNYVQFDTIVWRGGGARGRVVRVTVQWAKGESPGAKAARLQDELNGMRARTGDNALVS